MAESHTRPRVLHAAAFTAFFLSGASSLVFQTLWSRLLSHVFGSSSIAVSSVVSVFMGGLGLGAYVFGRRAERLRDPLLLYALAESAVGCAALVIPTLLKPDGWLAQLNGALREQLGAGSGMFMFARFACIVPILIVPTTLMGATLPLLTRHFVSIESDADQASRMVGRLYAINTFGAVTGVFSSSFVLLPRFGVHVANLVAAGTNFALALLILALRRRTQSQPIAASANRHNQPARASRAPDLPLAMRRAAALAFAGSGFSSLLYEVVWARALVNTIGGSLYAFALILTTFLIGIATGSALLSALFQRRVQALTLAAVGGSLASSLVYAPWAVQHGAPAACASLAATLALIGASVRLARHRAERDARLMLSETARPDGADAAAYLVLLIPVLSALAALPYTAARLSHITLAVICAICGFLALLLALRARPFGCLIALQVFIAAGAWMSAAFADELSLTFASMVAPLHEELPQRVGSVQAFMFLTAALCVLPSALGMGAVFPASLRVWTSGGAGIARDVGVVYAGNTLGSIFGAWLPGFVLMPSLGMQQTLYVGVAWNLGTALVLSGFAIHHAPAGSRARTRAAVLAAALPWLLALVAFAALRPERLLGWNISTMTLGAFRIKLARDVLDQETWGAPELVYYRDGLSTTVTVERWGRHLSLKNNGKVDASNGDDMPTQIMVAALPILLHEPSPQPLDAAIVGFGSGVSVGAALQFALGSVDVIELERATVDASRYFAEANHLHYVLDDFPYVREPGLRVIADDGRNYLAATRRAYDVIISEPSNPWLTGVSDLFTNDHFAIAKRRLRPGGVYCQWAQLYELSQANIKILYRTFAENFEHVLAFSAADHSSDTILVGSDSPLPLDLARIAGRLSQPKVAAELRRAHVERAEDVIARLLIASRAEALRFSAGAPLNTDDNARIELAAPRDLIGVEPQRGYAELMYTPDWPYGRVVDRLRGLGSGPSAAEHCAALAMSLLAHGRNAEIPALLEHARGYGETSGVKLAAQVYALLTDPAREPALGLQDPTPPSSDRRAVRLLHQAYAAIQEQLTQEHYATALAQLEVLPSRLRRGAGPGWDLLEGYVRYKAGQHEIAIGLFEDLLRDHASFAREHASLYYFLARAHAAERRFDRAVSEMRTYLTLRDNVLAASPAPAPSLRARDAPTP